MIFFLKFIMCLEVNMSESEQKNIFQIWRDIGEKVPFAVRRWNWDL